VIVVISPREASAGESDERCAVVTSLVRCSVSWNEATTIALVTLSASIRAWVKIVRMASRLPRFAEHWQVGKLPHD
jgi:hypothetical protein